MFFSTFLFRMTIVYRSKKTHQNANDFSRLISKSIKKIFFLSTIIIENKNEFFDHLANALSENDIFHKIHKHLRNQVERIKNDENEINTTY
jgi:signal recognition particle GTPase